MKIAAVIPAYNEEEHLASIAKEVLNYVDFLIIVDDGSSEKPKDLPSSNKLYLLHHIINRGQGAALQTGSDFALKLGLDIIFHFDADGQFLAKEIPEILEPILSKRADIVLGSRFLNKNSDLPRSKKYIIMPLARLINHFFVIKTSDPQSGFRAYTKEVALSFRIENDRMAHCSEILMKFSKSNWRLEEVPITVLYHEYGQRFSGGFRIIKDLILERLRN